MRTPAAVPVGLALVLTGCAGSDDEGGGPRDHGAHAFGHVHGLGVNPANGRLYVASHLGVFRETADGFERVADRWQDTMAFTVVGPDHFLASGHPDLREDKPVHLGLVESTDAAETWKPLSLEGEADFHALESAGGRLYGLDALTGQLMVTTDRTSWKRLGPLTAVDLAADPADPRSLLATDGRGGLLRPVPGGRPEPVPGSPALVLVDWPAENLLVGVGPTGQVFRSRDGGTRWHRLSPLPGPPQALAVTHDRWYAATESGLVESDDAGRTWVDLEASG